MTPPSNVIACAGTPVVVNFSGSSGATYEWTNDNPAIGLAASGTGNINVIAASTNVQQVAHLTVRPKVGTCYGPLNNFTITINPLLVMDDPPDRVVCSGEDVQINFSGPANPTFSWANSNTAIGLPASGTGNIHFTAANVTVGQNATITVTPTGGMCGAVPQTFSLGVLPVPTVNSVPDFIGCSDQPVNISFSGNAGTTFNWTNDNPNIGLPTSGTGNLSFVGTTLGGIEVGHLVVTPQNGVCSGSPRTFSISIHPSPSMNPIGNRSVCAGSAVKIEFSSNENPIFNWTNSNTAIGLAASGAGNIQFNAANVVAPQTSFVSVVPTQNGCNGAAQVFSITVNPPISVVADNVKFGCDTLPTILTLTTNSNPANYYWTGPNGFNSILKNPTIDTIGNYIVVVTNPISGCTATDTAFVTNCCITKAGSFDTLKIILCNKKPFNGFYKNNEVLEGNDQLKFILFKDTLNILGSILAYSDSAYFVFNADTMFLDTTYFIAAIAADTTKKKDSISLKDPCLSISKRLSVIWKSNPTITQLPFSTAICKDDCINLVFEFTGTPPFSYQLKIEQNGLLLYDKSMISMDFIQPLTICPTDFIPPMVGGELHFSIGALTDFYCGCGK